MSLYFGDKYGMQKSNMQIQWEKNKELERIMKLEKLKQMGVFNVEDRSQRGQTERTGMDNAGKFAVENLREGGLNSRLGITEKGMTERTGMDNAGKFSVADLENRGMTERTAMDNAGSLAVAGLQDLGQTTRTGMEVEGYNLRNKYMTDAEKKKSEVEQQNKLIELLTGQGMPPAEAAAQSKFIRRYMAEGGAIEDIMPTAKNKGGILFPDSTDNRPKNQYAGLMAAGHDGVSPVVKQNNALNAFNSVGTNINSPTKSQDSQPYQYPTSANMQGMGQYGYQQQGGVSGMYNNWNSGRKTARTVGSDILNTAEKWNEKLRRFKAHTRENPTF